MHNSNYGNFSRNLIDLWDLNLKWIVTWIYIVSWEPKGGYSRLKMFHWEPEGLYRHWLCTAIAPFWFSMEHLWAAIMPFWLSTDDMYCANTWIGYHAQVMERPVLKSKVQDVHTIWMARRIHTLPTMDKITAKQSMSHLQQRLTSSFHFGYSAGNPSVYCAWFWSSWNTGKRVAEWNNIWINPIKIPGDPPKKWNSQIFRTSSFKFVLFPHFPIQNHTIVTNRIITLLWSAVIFLHLAG